MSKVIGVSGAWKSIIENLNNSGFRPQKPSEISGLLDKAKKEYKNDEAKATKQIQNKIENLKKNLQELEEGFESEVQHCREKISAEIEVVQLELYIFQNHMGWIQRFINYRTIKKHKAKLLSLKNKYKNCSVFIQKKIDSTKKTLVTTQNNIDTFISDECRISRSNIFLLETTLASPDLAGAIAELELIEKLKTLPDNYYLLNDVKLTFREGIRFDGEWLRSAQIDHVVLSPSGIFVIEVKNWSKKFTEDGNYFDPYHQVKRASYVCYRFIGERYNLKTRSVIAYKGSIPKKPTESHVKVLPIEKVKNYILWFKEITANNQDIEDAANSLVN